MLPAWRTVDGHRLQRACWASCSQTSSRMCSARDWTTSRSTRATSSREKFAVLARTRLPTRQATGAHAQPAGTGRMASCKHCRGEHGKCNQEDQSIAARLRRQPNTRFELLRRRRRAACLPRRRRTWHDQVSSCIPSPAFCQPIGMGLADVRAMREYQLSASRAGGYAVRPMRCLETFDTQADGADAGSRCGRA